MASFPPPGESIAADAATEVIRQSALDQAQGKRAPAFGTVDLSELGEALDAFIEHEAGPGAAHDAHRTRDGLRNLHDPALAATAVPSPKLGDGSEYHQTVQRQLTPDEALTVQRVSSLWQTTIRPSDHDRDSLKGTVIPSGRALSEPASEASSANVSIHRRRLVSSPTRGGQPPDYELLEVLGEGGMGVVYSARQTAVDRTIALKMLKPNSASTAESRGKFLAEAAVTSDLDHPNIVPIYDLGQNEDGSLFYAMKRVRGKPWLDVMFTRELHENLATLLRVADAVAFAHARGVIHRDLKPENVMLGDFGEVLLMDWGLAVGVDPSSKASAFTRIDSVGGTPAYMAPEMAGGPLVKIGKHSDIYLLGGMLWEIITGNPPHTGKTVMACLMAAGVNAITPTEKRGELVDIALKAMATNPEERYPTVKAFQDAIREYQSHENSIRLSAEAQKHLEDAKKNNKYDDFSRAAFGFEQALALWTDSRVARQGRSTSQRLFAQVALANRDLDLADSLLDRDDPTHAELIPQVAAARADREKRQRQLRNRLRLLVSSIALTIAILAGS
ncbi:MAG TPA: serine/threonine-protein kinase, partial [Pirellulales bacterium]